MKLSLAVTLIVALSHTATAQPQHDGVFSTPGGGWDNGCYGQWRTTSSANAYVRPSAASEKIRTIDSNRLIGWNDRSEALTVVTRPGLARTRRAITIQASTEAEHLVDLNVAVNKEIELLAYGGEANSFFRMDGVLYVGFVPATQWLLEGYPELRRDFEIVRLPRTQLWVLLVPRPGKPAAWLNVNQNGIEEVDPYCD